MKRILVFGSIALALLCAGCTSRLDSPRKIRSTTDAKAGRSASASVRRSNGKVYPWSIVSGGLDSAVLMRAVMSDDPVVREHYAGLDPNKFRIERLSTPKQGYVSYRIRDKVYWTRKPATLAAGELVLTDGQSMLRGRCGNQVSSIPRDPVAPPSIEPPETALDTPVDLAQLSFTPILPGLPTNIPLAPPAPESPVVASEAPKTGAVVPVGGAPPTPAGTTGGVTGAPAPPPEQLLYIPGRTAVPPVVPTSPVTPPAGSNFSPPIPYIPPPVVPSGPIIISTLVTPPGGIIPPPFIAPDVPVLPPVVTPPGNPGTPPVFPPPYTPPGTPGQPPPVPSDPPPPPSTNPPGPTSEPNPPGDVPPDTPTPTPEPATWMMFAAGALGIVVGCRRRR